LPRLLSSRAFAPVFAGHGPQTAIETEAVDRGRRGERADAVEADARPLETAFLQHAARGGIAHPRPADEHVVAKIAEGMIDRIVTGGEMVVMAVARAERSW
jgi:hypothetical protein